MVLFQLLCVSCICVTLVSSECTDIDSQACSFMASSSPDFCSDETIAKTACPKFCNLCPIKCFSCNSTLSDYHLCKTTVTCQTDEVCMRRQLRSFVDGHEEFEMTCAKKTYCDDPWRGVSMFGRRELSHRDLSVTCCTTDLCNYPEITTTTTTTTTTPATTTPAGCRKDLMLAVDKSSSMNTPVVKQFLKDVIRTLPIGSTETLVSLGLFGGHQESIFDIGDHTTQASTLAPINHISLNALHGFFSIGVKYLLNHATTSLGGDRPNYPNVLLVLTDDYRPRDLNSTIVGELKSKAEQVIVIDMPTDTPKPGHEFLATDSKHYFKLYSDSELLRIVQHVSSLIC